jgi:hypothetical protein
MQEAARAGSSSSRTKYARDELAIKLDAIGWDGTSRC